MTKKHKFINFDKQSQKWRVRIQQKKTKAKEIIFCKFLSTLEEAIIARDNFLNKYQDKRYKGVTYNKQNKNWSCFITLKGKQIHLGSYKTQEEAKEFRNKVLMDLMN